MQLHYLHLLIPVSYTHLDVYKRQVQIVNASGLTVGRYEHLVLVSESSVVDADGTVTTTYSLREKSDVEKRLDNVETGQAIQDGAISDLGEVSSLLAEQIEGGAV